MNSAGEAVLNSNMSKWHGMTTFAPMSFARCAASSPERFPGTRLSGDSAVDGKQSDIDLESAQFLCHPRISDGVAAVVERPSAKLQEHIPEISRGPDHRAPRFRAPTLRRKIECPTTSISVAIIDADRNGRIDASRSATNARLASGITSFSAGISREDRTQSFRIQMIGVIVGGR